MDRLIGHCGKYFGRFRRNPAAEILSLGLARTRLNLLENGYNRAEG
jgi:hypothetical protein